MPNKNLAFLDLEVSPTSHKIQNIGILLDGFDKISQEYIDIKTLKAIFTKHKVDFICGHNFVNFDKKYLANTSFNVFVQNIPIIDTLYLSLLLFPDKNTHKLEKPYKQTLHRENPHNEPLQDCENTKNLYFYLDECFKALPQNLQDIFTLLLKDNEYFKGFFLCKQNKVLKTLEKLLKEEFGLEEFEHFVKTPIEFAFVLSFITMIKIKEARYFSPFILKNYPLVVRILKDIKDSEKVDVEAFAQDEFAIHTFRTFKRMKNQSLLDVFAPQNISQKELVESALKQESFLAILPTGGGKTFTFQLPALIKARQIKALTVVISPLQALMQNHIESFKLKNQNFSIEAISGFLNPIKRFEVFDKLKNGTVDILYLAPEALRSNSIFKALQKRNIERFVIDEAHCFSMWGHNFRQDYHFIAQTIKDLEQSPHQDKISVSCFTATAKPEVIEDIKQYFQRNLQLNLKEFIASSERKSLSYEVISVKNKEEKFDTLWRILRQEFDRVKGNKNPTIIYIPQNAGLCKKLWLKLKDKCKKFGLHLIIEPFYAKLDDDVANGKKEGRKKAEILQDFIDDKIDIIIATTAFGMGIDKPNITTIIHYELSDSLESYIQEAGRGARDEDKYKAKCFILYDKKDIDKNFIQLRQSYLDFGEIVHLVRVLKDEYKMQKKNPIYVSLNHLHKHLGKDEKSFEPTLMQTALLELEKAEFLQRKRKMTQIYATSFKLKEGKDKMNLARKSLDLRKENIEAKDESKRTFDEKEFLKLYKVMILTVQNIIQRSRNNSLISLDELSDIVGSIEESKMVLALKFLEEAELLTKENDILIFVDSQKAKIQIEEFFAFERTFFEHIKEYIKKGQAVDLREFNNEKLKKLTVLKHNPLYPLKFIIKSWAYLLKLASISFKFHFKNEQCFFERFDAINKLDKAIKARESIALFTLNEIIIKLHSEQAKSKGEVYLSSSQLYTSLKENNLQCSLSGFHSTLNTIDEIVDREFEIIRGRLIYYQKQCIEFNPHKIKEARPYLKEHYNNSFKVFMEQKISNIHILQSFLDNFVEKGENAALMFMSNYFSLPKNDFLKEYKIDKKFIQYPISKDLLNAIIKDLNPTQTKILNDTSQAIMIFAGPGSGKTKTLVHKMAHLLTKEDKKSENFLMLAHSRVAVLEFKSRLYKLLGEQSLGVKILTFHSFALNLLGEKVFKDNELKDKISLATKALKENQITLPYIQMLVLDEYQDVNNESYEFIKAIYEKMPNEKQIIAVGDDDQLIAEFLGANKKFIENFEQDFSIKEAEQSSFSKHTLSINYRSASRLVDFANAFRKEFLKDSLKQENLQANPQNEQKAFISYTHHQCNLSLKVVANEVLNISKENQNSQIGILLRNNDEVLAMRCELENLEIKANYILEKEGFKLGNLAEFWEFLECLKMGLNKNEAYQKISEKYRNSHNLSLFKQALKHFEKEYSEDLDYLKDFDEKLAQSILTAHFENFLQELSFDEFEYSAHIIISTMHKAKGKEFDFVFIVLRENFQFDENAEKRLLYVAITRAKQGLFIHTQKDFLHNLKHFFDEFKIEDKKEQSPFKISYIMGLKDIQLDNKFIQSNLKSLRSNCVAGDECEIRIESYNGNEYINILYEGKAVASLSQKFREKLFEKVKQGYELSQKARLKYAVKWQNDKNEVNTEFLCEIILTKAK